MDRKETIQYATAVAMLPSGMVMSSIGFFAELRGHISDSVLWYVAQTLIYAGSVFGFAAYVDCRIRDLKK